MRLLSREYYEDVLEGKYGFEGYLGPENVADANADDDWYTGGHGGQDWTSWPLEETRVRSGSKSIHIQNANDQNIYQQISNPRTAFEIEAWANFDFTGPGNNPSGFLLQIDDGHEVGDPCTFCETEADLILYDTVGEQHAPNAVAVNLIFSEDNSNAHVKVYSRFDSSAVTLEQTGDANTDWLEDTWIGVRIRFDSNGYQVWVNNNEAGWILQVQGAWTNTSTMGGMDMIRLGTGTPSANTEIYADDVKIYWLATHTTEEITGITSIQANKAMYGAGRMTARIRDLGLTNYSTYEDYLWGQWDVWDNDLGRKLWEGYITDVRFDPPNHIILTGIETLAALDEIPCEYNTLLAEGEVTNVNADSIDDDNASFTAALVDKIATFTDTTGPTIEIDYPNSNSVFKQADRTTGITLDYESGAYTDLAEYGKPIPTYWRGTVDHNDFCMILEFTVANAASTTAFEVELPVAFKSFDNYSTVPDLYIYNADDPGWEKVGDFNSAAELYKFNHEDLVDDSAPENYFDGTTFKLAIHAGTYDSGNSTVERIDCYLAKMTNTYSSVFTAQGVAYTVDARDGDTLTFTGQTPQSDGIAAADRYKVGDYLHNNLNEIWNASLVTVLGLHIDTTTIVDAGDSSSSYIGPILRTYATMMDRYYWQAYGYNIKCPSSYIDTTINLTETHICKMPNGDWDQGSYQHMGRNERRKVKVIGAGVYYENEQVCTHNTPLGLIYSDSRLATQQNAEDIGTSLLADHVGPKKFLRLKIKMLTDTAYSRFDIGKTIDVAFTETSITNVTAGLIHEMHFSQTRGGNLFNLLVIEI